MFPTGVGEVAGRIVVVDQDVGRERRAGEAAFDQVVRQQRVLGEPALSGVLKGVDVVDPLPGEAPLAVEVLVHVRHRGGVRIDARVTRLDRREARPVRARQRDPHPRLQDAVAGDDPAQHGVVDRAVERMGQRTHQERGGVRREHRVGVEGDDVAHPADRVHVAHHRAESAGGAAPEKVVEVGQLAALPLPPHPDALPRVPAPGPVEQVERVLGAAAVALIERADPGDARLEDRGVALAGLGSGIGEVG